MTQWLGHHGRYVDYLGAYHGKMVVITSNDCQSNQIDPGKSQEVLPGVLPCLSGPFNSCGIRVGNPWMGGLGDGRVLIDRSTIILINTYIIT